MRRPDAIASPRAATKKIQLRLTPLIGKGHHGSMTGGRGRFAAILGLGIVALAVLQTGATTPPRRRPAELVLWAWERPEDLRFADSSRFSIAYLAGTLTIAGDDLVVRPRFQPLLVRDDARILPVVRIEVARGPAWAPGPLLASRAAQAIVRLAGGDERSREREGEGERKTVQIDFDATLSQRDFYRDLLAELRGRLPAHRKISITALASWCEGDRWLESLPVDEAVPMLFRMGREGPEALRRFASHETLDPRCRGSVGVSTDEPGGWDAPVIVSRTYVFHPRPWKEPAARAALARRRSL
jgi:hypothetical protein